MYFKAKFNVPIDESLVDNFAIDMDYDSLNGKEIIHYKNHEFEIERDDAGLICELTFCNQCVQTFDIEEIFIELVVKLLQEDEALTLLDSDGLEEELSKDELIDMY